MILTQIVCTLHFKKLRDPPLTLGPLKTVRPTHNLKALWIREIANGRVKLQSHFCLLDLSLKTTWASLLDVKVLLRLMRSSLWSHICNSI